jgi:hypothetical protein
MGFASSMASQIQSATPSPEQNISPPVMPMVQTQPLANPQDSWQAGKGKGSSSHPMQGQQGSITFPGQGGQPAMGQPNQYSNTIGSWDNPPTGMSTQPANNGKGKGA